uniref:Glucuronosyltransferase n=1 Tax=Phlebotomus papatasi TaxID=29031 RepID=A0A1B0D9I5_PHLPP
MCFWVFHHPSQAAPGTNAQEMFNFIAVAWNSLVIVDGRSVCNWMARGIQGNIRAHVPAMVEIGGIHIEEERDALPMDIQEFLDSASNGAILFSFGSNVKSSMLPKPKLDAILRALAGLKQKVLFKWENDDLPNKPHNMMIKKWLPQTDILAHKKSSEG